MKKIAFALVGAVALALAGCGSKSEDALGNDVGENTDMMVDNSAGMDEANMAAGPENTTVETNDVTPPAPPPLDEADEAAQNVTAM